MVEGRKDRTGRWRGKVGVVGRDSAGGQSNSSRLKQMVRAFVPAEKCG